MPEGDENIRTAVVTGGGRGIGAAAVRRLVRAGWTVTAVVRDPARASEVLADVEGVTIMRGDLHDAGELEEVARTFDGRALDLLVANAARFAPWDQTASTADLEDVLDSFEVNVLGTWRTLQAFLPALRRAKDAQVIVVGSGAGSHSDPRFGITSSPGAAGYAVSKAAVHALVRKAATELAPEGIEVYGVDPGLTATSPDMEQMGARPPAVGAESVLWPALLPGSVDPGTLTRDGRELGW
ncbi:hypothetical protein ARHIZOSPH14_07470 [Agromyces rhizosphaerae]|uniref:SDR family NAD(P)-dependent oxidoreductase n=1 Tax=Agromyces rhizosphaerae TaxID=88374 RepID=A0A9W6FNJ7_9MICO|nr:SDR family NAD(P)-dependent oxidoreductase [Agromyces rhizosphaerae]GLI26505.1 hypothetical protein ARHIZOSPH14_07470 [Agromyces rhizosphaerae]